MGSRLNVWCLRTYYYYSIYNIHTHVLRTRLYCRRYTNIYTVHIILYVRSKGWFWRVTVGGDRTQWFCASVCVWCIYALACMCGVYRRERSHPPESSSGEEFVRGKSCPELLSHTPSRAPPYIPLYVSTFTRPPAAAPTRLLCTIITNIVDLNLSHTHTQTRIKMSYLRFTRILLFTVLHCCASNDEY